MGSTRAVENDMCNWECAVVLAFSPAHKQKVAEKYDWENTLAFQMQSVTAGSLPNGAGWRPTVTDPTLPAVDVCPVTSEAQTEPSSDVTRTNRGRRRQCHAEIRGSTIEHIQLKGCAGNEPYEASEMPWRL